MAHTWPTGGREFPYGAKSRRMGRSFSGMVHKFPSMVRNPAGMVRNTTIAFHEPVPPILMVQKWLSLEGTVGDLISFSSDKRMDRTFTRQKPIVITKKETITEKRS